jgi:hypothetical protein
MNGREMGFDTYAEAGRCSMSRKLVGVRVESADSCASSADKQDSRLGRDDDRIGLDSTPKILAIRATTVH